MATAQLPRQDTSTAAISTRIWESWGRMTPAVAKHVLKLRFTEEDNCRMHDLAARNQEGRLTPTEAEELDNYIVVGDLLAILQSRARKLLKKKPASSSRHG